MFGSDYDTMEAGAVSDFLDIFFFSFGYKAGGGIGKMFSYLVLTAHQPAEDGLADFLFVWTTGAGSIMLTQTCSWNEMKWCLVFCC